MSGPDIRPPGEIDAAWLSQVLAAGGIDASVSSFTAQPVGTGQIGDSVRFRLSYDRRWSASSRPPARRAAPPA